MPGRLEFMGQDNSKNDLITVDELSKQTGQTESDVLSFLEKRKIPVLRIGTGLFFRRDLLLGVFAPEGGPGAPATGEKLLPDEVERRHVIAELDRLGLRLQRREGTREMVLVVRVKNGWEVPLDLLFRDQKDILLFSDIDHVFKVYVARNLARGVVHFTASGFLEDPPQDLRKDHGVVYIFRSSKLGLSFLRTQVELIKAWNALSANMPECHKGIRLQGEKSLQLTFSRSMTLWLLERRIPGHQITDAGQEAKTD